MALATIFWAKAPGHSWSFYPSHKWDGKGYWRHKEYLKFKFDKMETDNAFLGRGWGFPPTFDKASKSVGMLEEEKDIESSLEILLSTRLGERIMQPNYGCNLDDMVFEVMNLTMLTYLKDLVENAILYFEPRIDLEDLRIDTSQGLEGVLLIIIDYTVRTTNSRFNFVYPFYINEGSNLPLNR